MLKTLRDTNNRVVGIVINNKKYSLPKEVCLALGNEESLAIKKAKEASAGINEIKSSLAKEYFQGFSRNMNIEVQFDSDNQINFMTGKIDFVGSFSNLNEEQRRFALEVIEAFIFSLNNAIEAHMSQAKSSLKSLSRKSA